MFINAKLILQEVINWIIITRSRYRKSYKLEGKYPEFFSHASSKKEIAYQIFAELYYDSNEVQNLQLILDSMIQQFSQGQAQNIQNQQNIDFIELKLFTQQISLSQKFQAQSQFSASVLTKLCIQFSKQLRINEQQENTSTYVHSSLIKLRFRSAILRDKIIQQNFQVFKDDTKLIILLQYQGYVLSDRQMQKNWCNQKLMYDSTIKAVETRILQLISEGKGLRSDRVSVHEQIYLYMASLIMAFKQKSKQDVFYLIERSSNDHYKLAGHRYYSSVKDQELIMQSMRYVPLRGNVTLSQLFKFNSDLGINHIQFFFSDVIPLLFIDESIETMMNFYTIIIVSDPEQSDNQKFAVDQNFISTSSLMNYEVQNRINIQHRKLLYKGNNNNTGEPFSVKFMILPNKDGKTVHIRIFMYHQLMKAALNQLRRIDDQQQRTLIEHLPKEQQNQQLQRYQPQKFQEIILKDQQKLQELMGILHYWFNESGNLHSQYKLQIQPTIQNVFGKKVCRTKFQHNNHNGSQKILRIFREQLSINSKKSLYDRYENKFFLIQNNDQPRALMESSQISGDHYIKPGIHSENINSRPNDNRNNQERQEEDKQQQINEPLEIPQVSILNEVNLHQNLHQEDFQANSEENDSSEENRCSQNSYNKPNINMSQGSQKDYLDEQLSNQMQSVDDIKIKSCFSNKQSIQEGSNGPYSSTLTQGSFASMAQDKIRKRKAQSEERKSSRNSSQRGIRFDNRVNKIKRSNLISGGQSSQDINQLNQDQYEDDTFFNDKIIDIEQQFEIEKDQLGLKKYCRRRNSIQEEFKENFDGNLLRDQCQSYNNNNNENNQEKYCGQSQNFHAEINNQRQSFEEESKNEIQNSINPQQLKKEVLSFFEKCNKNNEEAIQDFGCFKDEEKSSLKSEDYSQNEYHSDDNV